MAQRTVEEAFPGGVAARTRHRAVIDARRYTDPSAMAAEWQHIWTRCWLFAGIERDIPEPGDYFIYDIGRESIIVLRDQEGAVRAFYNACQHRGNRLLANTCGAVERVTCPYHGWTYSLDGTLEVIPDAALFQPPVARDSRGLQPVRTALWAGMVWLNMDAEAISLEDYLGPIIGNLAPFRFEDMVLAGQQTVHLDANWKTVRDNFLEQYHVDFIHPQHASLVDCCNSRNILWPYGHSATLVEGYVTNSRYPLPRDVPAHLVPLLEGLGMDPAQFRGRVPEIRAAVQRRKRELGAQLGFDYGPLSDEQVSDVWQYDIFPNTFLTMQAEELWIYGPRPHPSDPDRCFFDKWTLQVPVERATDTARGLTLNPGLCVSVAAERPEREVFTAGDVIDGLHTLGVTIDQDIHYLANMQAGLHSRGFATAVLNVEEERMQHFHDWVDERLRGSSLGASQQ